MADEIADGTVSAENRAVTERAERLKVAVRDAGGPTAVAKRAELHVGTLNNYLGGRDMKAANLVSLADATGVRLEWLALGVEPMHRSETIAGQDVAMRSPGTALSLAPGTVLIDRHDARASAGRNGVLADTAVIERVVFSEGWVRKVLRRNPQNLAILEAFGDSMEPTIGDGDVIMIDVVVDDLVSGRIYVVDFGGELQVKRIQRRMNGSLLVMSDNTRYPPEEVAAGEGPHLRIVGEVVWHAHAL